MIQNNDRNRFLGAFSFLNKFGSVLGMAGGILHPPSLVPNCQNCQTVLFCLFLVFSLLEEEEFYACLFLAALEALYLPLVSESVTGKKTKQQKPRRQKTKYERQKDKE